MRLIIDCLTHIDKNEDDVIGWGPRFLAENLIERMDVQQNVLGKQTRIDKAVVFPALGKTIPTSNLNFDDQHAYVKESIVKHPDRLIGGIVIHQIMEPTDTKNYP